MCGPYVAAATFRCDASCRSSCDAEAFGGKPGRSRKFCLQEIDAARQGVIGLSQLVQMRSGMRHQLSGYTIASAERKAVSWPNAVALRARISDGSNFVYIPLAASRVEH